MDSISSTGTKWSPAYPTPAALAYRDGFLQGAAVAGLRNIPDDVLSWAIDRAIATRTPPLTAGRVFADCYFDVSKRREPRGGYGNATSYLLAAYEGELKNGKV